MAKDYDYKIIKKHYGEKFAHFCNSNFQSISDHGDGVLANHIASLFSPNKSLSIDIQDENVAGNIKDFVLGRFGHTTTEYVDPDNRTPAELLKLKGYTLYECHTVEDVERFKSYYKPEDELCTFKDIAGRLEKCHIFFIVRDDADTVEYPPEIIIDKTNPEKPKEKKGRNREDLYSTSVLSLQFDKGFINHLAIISRYNHSVERPNATYGNNPELIVKGLTNSFRNHYGFNYAPKEGIFTIPGYVGDKQGKRYKYNVEVNGTYYCVDNIFINDGEFNQLDKFTKVLVGNYIFDIKNNTISNAETLLGQRPWQNHENRTDSLDSDSFLQSFGDIVQIQILPGHKQDNRLIVVQEADGNVVKVEIDRNNDLIAFENNGAELIGDDFLMQFKNIESIKMLETRRCGHNFCFHTKKNRKLIMPKLQHCKTGFFYFNKESGSIDLSDMRSWGPGFFENNPQARADLQNSYTNRIYI